MSQAISWIHFGDLHISNSGDQNYLDFLTLIDEANGLGPGIAFCLLPGDNADDGEEDQYALVRGAISLCRLPVHAITGDHDVAGDGGRSGTGLFRAYLSDKLHKSFTMGGVHFVFLNSVAEWKAPGFGLGHAQMAWLRDDLNAARKNGWRIVVFMHAYPSEHEDEAGELAAWFKEAGVALVEMGHTHYNELANDGHTIYAATRSTGQVEEGPAGFSIGTIDDGVVSWKFKPIGERAAVVITSPADERLIIDPSSPAQVLRGRVAVRARVWGEGVQKVTMFVAGRGSALRAMEDGCTWTAEFDTAAIADGAYEIEVIATMENNRAVSDRVRVLVNQQGRYEAPPRQAIDYENALGEWRDKHVLGTQLGPNENGRHWHSRHDAERDSK